MGLTFEQLRIVAILLGIFVFYLTLFIRGTQAETREAKVESEKLRTAGKVLQEQLTRLQQEARAVRPTYLRGDALTGAQRIARALAAVTSERYVQAVLVGQYGEFPDPSKDLMPIRDRAGSIMEGYAAVIALPQVGIKHAPKTKPVSRLGSIAQVGAE